MSDPHPKPFAFLARARRGALSDMVGELAHTLRGRLRNSAARKLAAA